ncbi:MAG: Acetyl-coenzyme A synthetase [Chlamydiales bacterium]|nr:Acetyl-coenzyme A synthetase [Chlamydiales bacterium]MCH9634880.1 Acetyl-coenzyme A synthetase [Chlamydiales bacterium]MCH9703707.1 AMP-binding protein [Chlamydiota bacterium]
MDSEFWTEQANKIDWFQPWDKLLEWNPPYAKWYLGGKLNACYNCVDRHPPENLALIWTNEVGDEEKWSYGKLLQEVQNFAAELKRRGIQKGDAIGIYLPMVPQAVVAMLACARIGAVHTVIFAGFATPALKERLEDCKAKLLITKEWTWRGGKQIPLVSDVNTPKMIIEELPNKSCSCEEMDSEDPLFYLYTSGTTGKPKGVVHTTAGYMVGATQTCERVFGLKPGDLYWCTADVGWITGHSYVVYGPLSRGSTILLYEGAIEQETCWKLIEKYGVEIFYTAPTAIRLFMSWGESHVQKYDLSSLRLLGSVGEPLNPEAWEWYHEFIGNKRCPIMDTWWQTETGSIMISPTPTSKLKAGSAAKPLPGVEAEVQDGALVIKEPWPSMLRGIRGDPKRYEETYWKEGVYITGDSATVDEDGYYWLLGRNDDVINVSGHRLGSAEIESALVDSPHVAEAAVVSVPHEIKGEAIFAFVVERSEQPLERDYERDLKTHVAKLISPIAKPQTIVKVRELPKTRSGKIMRRLLKGLLEGREPNEMSTLSNPSSLEAIKEVLD